jgi:hypothetical protein
MVKQLSAIIVMVVLLGIPSLARAQDDTSRGNRLFADDFSTFANVWETQDTGKLMVDYDRDNYAFYMDVQSVGAEAWSTPHTFLDLTRYVIEVTAISEATNSADSTFGLLLNYVDEDNFYVFTIRASGYYEVRLRLDGEWQATPLVFGKASEAESYRLSVESDEGVFELSLNDKALVPFVNTEISGGKFGLYAQAGDGPMVVRFDDYLVRDLDQAAGD